MKIALLHTADVHVATFKAIFDELDPSIELIQRTRTDLLADARAIGLSAIRTKAFAELRKIADADAAVCTCSTLGPLVDEFDTSNVVRIDYPLMQAACENGPRILVCICLESTRTATADILAQVAQDIGATIDPTILFCDAAWAYFETDDQAGFSESIHDSIAHTLADAEFDCIVLAQASMRIVEPKLSGIGVPVLSSPKLAAQRAIEIARSRS